MRDPEYKGFYEAIVSIGLGINGCSYDGRVDWSGTPNEPLASLVFKSLDKPLTSPECLALKAAITPEQWTAYQAVRKVPVDNKRLDKFQTEVLVLLVKLFKTATYVTQGTGKVAIFETVALQEARDKIAAIEAALPYPV